MLTWTFARPEVASPAVPQMSAVPAVPQPASQPPAYDDVGNVIARVGAVLSSVTVWLVLVVAFPARSVTVTVHVLLVPVSEALAASAALAYPRATPPIVQPERHAGSARAVWPEVMFETFAVTEETPPASAAF